MSFRKGAIAVFLVLLAINSRAYATPLNCMSNGETVPCAHDIDWQLTGGSSTETEFELSETASVTDAFGGSFSLDYPDDWTQVSGYEGTGTIALIGSSTSEILTIAFFPESMAAGLGGSPSDFLEYLMASLEQSLPADSEVSEVTETELGGNTAAYIVITTIFETETLYYVVDTEDGVIFAVSTGIEMEMLEAILLTARYEA